MRLSINGRFLDTAMTGVQRYAWEITRAIDQLVGEGDPTARGLDIRVLRPGTASTSLGLAHLAEHREGRRGGHYWEQFTLPRLAAGSRLINLCNMGPLMHRDAILCIHDAHVWLVPDNYSTAFRSYYRIMLPLLTRISARWTTVSRYSEEQLLLFGAANRPADAIIGNAAGDFARISPRRPARAGADIPSRFVFSLGSVARNKNLALLRDVGPVLAEAGIGVVTAGGANAAIFGTDGSPIDGMVHLGRVDDAELAWLYRNALCFAFPSFYEGFGIPPLEAMACSCPVVSSNTSALPEILGDAALWCDPRDPAAWTTAILQLAGNDTLRQSLIARGLARNALYSWKEAAKAYLSLARDGYQRRAQ